jgi:prolyl oligopeptidase
MVKPTMLYGYGGFNISLTPSFSIANAVWMENGAFTLYLTCGAENMEKWHDAGTKLSKMYLTISSLRQNI